MTAVHIEGEELVVRPRGLDKLWGFMRELRVPLRQVKNVRADPQIGHQPKGPRVAGTSLFRKHIGTFLTDGKASYWNVTDPDRNIVFELEGKGFHKVILTVDDPDRLERDITARVDRPIG